MSFKSSLNDMDAVLFNEFAEDSIYNGVSICHAVIDMDVEQFGGFDTRGAARRHEASLLVAEVPAPKRGQSLVTDTQKFVIDGVISNDGFVVKVHINES